MISYTNETFIVGSSPLDIFDGEDPTGKWVVFIELGGIPNGYIWISPDGTTLGQKLSASGSGYISQYRFVVEDQPLYLITTSVTNCHVGITVLPLVEGNISLGICSC